MNRHDNHPKPDHSSHPSHTDDADDGCLNELLAEDQAADDWDASHLPSFAAV